MIVTLLSRIKVIIIKNNCDIEMSGRISKEAYLLALLHAMKHFDCHVGGFLIGSIIGDKVCLFAFVFAVFSRL